MVTAPAFAQLCEDDITEAVEYAGLRHLVETHDGHENKQPREEATAYAGYGLGICEHYEDAKRCKEEEAALPLKTTLSVLHTGSALMTFIWPIKLANPSYYGVARPYRVTWDLSAPRNRSWDLVKLKLFAPIRDWNWGDRRHVDRVVLMGAGADSKEMLGAVREAMMEFQGDVPEIFQEDTLYVAARGAAEFAKRALDARMTGKKEGNRHGAL